MSDTCSAPYGGGAPTCTVPTGSSSTSTVVEVPSKPSEIPFTGGDVVGLSLIGLGAIAGGIALARAKRRFSV